MPFLLTGEPSEGESALMVAATIGSALRNRRRDLGIDQSDAAALIGMSRTTFSSYERDLQRPSAEVLPALAQFVAVSIEEMLALYGATCIETLRPSLERFLAANESSIKNRSPKYQGSPLDEAPVNQRTSLLCASRQW
jgi:transcriptional regulator with XRE-family HTH domain